MSRDLPHLVPSPAPSRRGGPARRSAPAWLAAALVVAATGFAGHGSAADPPDGCGRSGLVGLGSQATLGPGGALTLALTLTDGPLDPLPVRPLVFVDGVLRSDDGPLELPCRREVVWSTPPTGARHAVHWTVMPWPPVPPSLAVLTPDEAWRRFADGDPPGLYPWADVQVLRPAGASPAPHPDVVAARPAPSDAPGDDRVHVLGADGDPLAARWVRLPAGREVGFRLRYLAGELGAGPLLATCLLDGRQLDAFAGRGFVAAAAAAGHLLEIDGLVVVPGPGWHRLHCLLLPDGAGERPATWPRPLLAVYLWGEP